MKSSNLFQNLIIFISDCQYEQLGKRHQYTLTSRSTYPSLYKVIRLIFDIKTDRMQQTGTKRGMNEEEVSNKKQKTHHVSAHSQLLRIIDNSATDHIMVDCDDHIFDNITSQGIMDPFIYNDKAVINLSNMFIPDNVLKILSLGPKFYPVNNKIDYILLASDLTSILENNINANIRKPAMRHILDIVKKYKEDKPNNVKQIIINMLAETKEFLNQNKELLVTTADKGNVTVVVTKQFYEHKMSEHLQNPDTYIKMDNSSHIGFIKRNRALLTELSKESFLYDSQINNICSQETFKSKIYGLIKTHKDNLPIRPINSKINTPGTKICSIILAILNKMAAADPYEIENTEELMRYVKDTKLKPDDQLFSLDVVNMFTNIPPNLALDIILSKNFNQFTKMSRKLFSDLFQFTTLHNTEFQYNGMTFKQIKGLFMGSSCSPVIAKIVTTHILDEILPTCEEPTLVKKYVDDLIIITNKNNALDILSKLNKFHNDIKFTIEEEVEGRLNYLDVTIMRCDLVLQTKWYSKPMSSKRLINFYSNHSDSIIINTAINYVTKMLRFTEPHFRAEILQEARNILQINSFPLEVIQLIITRANNIIDNVSNRKQDDLNKYNQEYRGVLVSNDLLSKLNTCIKKFNPNVHISNKTSLKNLFQMIYTNNKDREDIENKFNIVVKFKCNACTFFDIQAITSPMVLLKVNKISLSSPLHIQHTIHHHVETHKHGGFDTIILRECTSRQECFIATQILCKVNACNIPKNVHSSLDNNLLNAICNKVEPLS